MIVYCCLMLLSCHCGQSSDELLSASIAATKRLCHSAIVTAKSTIKLFVGIHVRTRSITDSST